MKCPVDQAVLEISNRANIEIDYCPTCRGVWLDRGELDKIIERSDSAPVARPQAEAPRHNETTSYQQPQYREKDERSYHSDERHAPHKKKRESFLGDLFDF